ncbi:DNA/RNA non-specific endonuclease [Streptomyces pratensis]|uniref:DNA/RNA non-specific endonuclease n=1 Tax=Streptomyces pratensis TaxID=1169025 RepID=UPI003B75C70F
MGGRPRDVNACHLLGAQLSGSGTDLANLATCGAGANSYVVKPQSPIPPMESLLAFEDTVRSLVDSQRVVRYEVTPVYTGSRTAPHEFRMSYTAWNSRGATQVPTPPRSRTSFTLPAVIGRTWAPPSTVVPVPTCRYRGSREHGRPPCE